MNATQTLSIFDFPVDTVFQRGETNSFSPVVTGSCDGKTPVECRVLSSNGTPLTPWANAALDGESWSYSYPCVSGCWYKYQAQYSDGSQVAEQQQQFAVGSIIAYLGQSNGMQLSNYATGNPYPGSTCTRIWLGGNFNTLPTLEEWIEDYGWGSGTIAATILQAIPNYPVGGVQACVGGTSIGQWTPGVQDSAFDHFLEVLKRAGGAVEAVVWCQGEQDAVLATSTDAYQAALTELYSNLKTAFGNSELPLVIIQTGAVNGANAANIQTIQQAQKDWAAATPGVIWGGSLIGLPTADGMHITPDQNGAAVIGKSVGQALASVIA